MMPPLRGFRNRLRVWRRLRDSVVFVAKCQKIRLPSKPSGLYDSCHQRSLSSGKAGLAGNQPRESPEAVRHFAAILGVICRSAGSTVGLIEDSIPSIGFSLMNIHEETM